MAGYGDRLFEFAAPSLWNKLPLDLAKYTVDVFTNTLKTFLFKRACDL